MQTMTVFCFALTIITSQPDDKGASFEAFSTQLHKSLKTVIDIVLKLSSSPQPNETATLLSSECHKSLTSAYLTTNDNFYIEKLINDSSYNKNDIGSFLPCMKRKPSNADDKLVWNYLIATFSHVDDLRDKNTTTSDSKNKTKMTEEKHSEEEHIHLTINTSLYETKWKILGLCIAPGCTEIEYSTIIYYLDKHLEHFFQLHNILEVSTIVIESNNLGYPFDWMDLLKFLPCLIVLVQLLMSMLGIFPYFLFKSCFKNKNPIQNYLNEDSNQKGRNDSLSSSPYFDKKEFFKFTTTFSLARNSEELFGTSDGTSNLHNDSGMTYLKGIIGINIIFLIFGAVFFVLHLSPVAKINEIIFINYMRNFFFGVYFYGIRYAPRMLLSCSGFSLVYKLMCYFDECSLVVTEKNAGNTDHLEEMRESKPIINRQSQADEGEDDNEEMEYNDIYFSNILNFWKAQVHKYVIMILVTLFFKFSLYKLTLIFVNKGPLWEYFKRKVLDSPYSFDWLLILSFIFGLHSFYIPEDSTEYFLNYQWMVYNEIIFFMISSFMIYIGYRYKIRVDIFFLSTMCGILIMKLIVVFISSEYYSSLYYFFFKYGHIVSIPFFNYFYHIIGIMFGAANYVIQKDLSYKTAKKEKKYFLIPVIKVLNILKKKGLVLIYILGACIAITIIGLSVLQAIILHCYNVSELLNNHLEGFFSSLIKNLFMLFDTYIVVFLFHFSIFCFYLIGNNAIISFFTLKGWGILSKMYFSFILVVYPVILYFVYQSETQITFDIANTLLYSLICSVFSLLISCLFYISFELPYKRIVRLILKRLNEEEEDDRKAVKKEFGEDVLEESQLVSRTSI